MVAHDALRTHRPELLLEPGPELLQTHATDASAPSVRPAAAPGGRPCRGAEGHARATPRLGTVITTGSAALDTALEIGIAVCLLLWLVLLWRNYRGR